MDTARITRIYKYGLLPPIDGTVQAWAGDRAVTVTIDRGLSTPELFGGSLVAPIAIDETPQPVPGRAGKPRPRLRLTTGHVTGEWPIILHRPVPPEARILHAKVVRRERVPRARWTLYLTLTLPASTTEIKEKLSV